MMFEENLEREIESDPFFLSSIKKIVKVMHDYGGIPSLEYLQRSRDFRHDRKAWVEQHLSNILGTEGIGAKSS